MYCKSCAIEKSSGEFYAGNKSRCKECVKASVRQNRVVPLYTAPQPSAKAVRDAALEEAAELIDAAAKSASKEGDTKRKREYEFRAEEIRALKGFSNGR